MVWFHLHSCIGSDLFWFFLDMFYVRTRLIRTIDITLKYNNNT